MVSSIIGGIFGGIILILGSLSAIKKMKNDKTNMSIPGTNEFFKEKELQIPREILISDHGQIILQDMIKTTVTKWL